MNSNTANTPPTSNTIGTKTDNISNIGQGLKTLNPVIVKNPFDDINLHNSPNNLLNLRKQVKFAGTKTGKTGKTRSNVKQVKLGKTGNGLRRADIKQQQRHIYILETIDGYSRYPHAETYNNFDTETVLTFTTNKIRPFEAHLGRNLTHKQAT